MGIDDPERVFKGTHPVREADSARMQELVNDSDSPLVTE